MFDLSQIFISQAWAQTAPAADAGQGGVLSNLTQFMPLILIFLVFYVLIIRPQQKKMESQEKMTKSLQRGDRVVTSGGIHGKITKLDSDEHLTLEIADGVQIKVSRPHIAELAAKPNPASPAANDTDIADKKS